MHSEVGRETEIEGIRLVAAQLLEQAVCRNEGIFETSGALAVRTGQFTGRSPHDRYLVRDETTRDTVAWGSVNQPMTEEHFEQLEIRLLAFLRERELFEQDCYAGADPLYRLPVRVFTQLAWHALFARQLFIAPDLRDPERFHPQWRLYFAPEFQANPALDGTRSETAIAISFRDKTVLVCGTSYAGEMKKAIFSVLNYLLPARHVLPMHCSANMGAAGDVAVFFGLSGTGKTTLSADPGRRLIGDDEHGWSERGVFNFEGGCYAKCIRLSRDAEPQIWDAIRFGTVLENVVVDETTRQPDFDSAAITENTRAAYPLDYIANAVIPSLGGHPDNIFFLTADAFGVLPPISRLTPAQAMYHFLSGYTSKLAGTERGLGAEPQATFSACFGAPFLPRPSAVYAGLLGDKMRRHGARCWLVNTGWVGGPYGVGERIKLAYTRAMLNAALTGKLDGVPMKRDPVFRVLVPQECPDVPAEVLDARGMWADPAAYDRAARELSAQFVENFKQFTEVEDDVLAAAPAA